MKGRELLIKDATMVPLVSASTGTFFPVAGGYNNAIDSY